MWSILFLSQSIRPCNNDTFAFFCFLLIKVGHNEGFIFLDICYTWIVLVVGEGNSPIVSSLKSCRSDHMPKAGDETSRDPTCLRCSKWFISLCKSSWWLMLVVDYLGHIPMCCYSFQKVIPWRGNHHNQPKYLEYNYS